MFRSWGSLVAVWGLLVCVASLTHAQSGDVSQRNDYASSNGMDDQEATGQRKVPAKLASYGASYPSSCSGDLGGTPKPIGYGPMWPATGNRDCSRFYHYPYVFYPQNFRSNDYYRSSDSMYYRYPPEMQIPVYNKHWHNYYPSQRRYHWGHHFILDVF